MRKDLERDFIEDDGVICDVEMGILINFDQAVQRIKRARGMERGLELLMKQEGVPTKYTHSVFSDIGVKLEALDPLDPLDAA